MSNPTDETDRWDPDLINTQLIQHYLSGNEALDVPLEPQDDLASQSSRSFDEINKDLQDLLGSLQISENTNTRASETRNKTHPGRIVSRDVCNHRRRRISLPPEEDEESSSEESTQESSDRYSNQSQTPFEREGSEQKQDPRQVTLSPMGKSQLL
jgi:hypothetical protein